MLSHHEQYDTNNSQSPLNSKATMQAMISSLLTPKGDAVKFAIKGVLAMALALYVAMFFNLDRPYWALIGAIFLQMRPESGLVIEKGMTTRT